DLYAMGGAHDGYVYRSTDNGINWTKRGKVLPDSQMGVESILLSNGNLFISSFGDSIYRSTDSGATWTEISSGLSHQANTIFELFGVIDGKLYVSGGYSANNGDSWDTTSNNFPGGTLFFNGDNIFSAGVGVFLSTDRGANWMPKNTGLLYGTSIYPLAVIGNDLFVGTYNYSLQGANIYRSTNDGITWTGSIYQVTLNPLTFISANGKLFLGTLYGDSPIGVFRSTDSGASWTLPNDSLGLWCSDWGQGVSVLGAIGNELYAATCGWGFIRSSDDGKSWTRADSVVPPRIASPPYAFKGNIIFSYGGIISSSTDSGQHWAIDTAGLGNQYANFLTAAGSTIFAATDGAVFRSTNNGALWVPADSGLPYDNMTSLAVNGNNILVSTDSNGVFLSTNKGESWRNVNAGLNDLSVGSLVICGNYVYVNTATAIYRCSLSNLVTAVNENPPTLPTLPLLQNYPNPFNEMTNVEFRLPNEANVTLNVYNSLGEEVATLANGEMPAGEHSIPFTADGLRNGIYFYRLTAGKFTQTGKMSVVR
ncbi:MAG TPA: T9SS type A sorting domain-containing protein, partial [Candidatus Kapabacteria bacterium]|nr:T9SS type A sorting domain-containing protein [Candidatus Kapabacteria bacterium]